MISASQASARRSSSRASRGPSHSAGPRWRTTTRGVQRLRSPSRRPGWKVDRLVVVAGEVRAETSEIVQDPARHRVAVPRHRTHLHARTTASLRSHRPRAASRAWRGRRPVRYQDQPSAGYRPVGREDQRGDARDSGQLTLEQQVLQPVGRMDIQVPHHRDDEVTACPLQSRDARGAPRFRRAPRARRPSLQDACKVAGDVSPR